MAALSRAGIEAILVVISLGVYLGYHVWLIFIRGRGHKVNPEFHDFFAAGKLARSIWAETCARDEKDAILGVQQARNAMSACSYLATVAAVLATAGITVLLDSNKTERIAELAIRDPILRHAEGPPLAAPVAILGLALGALYGAFVCFAQSVRLYVHVGFYIRAVPSRWNPGTLHVAEAKKVAVKAGMAFTVGLRLFYLFIPLVLWAIGVTALLFSSIGMTIVIAYMDWFESPTPPTPAEQAESDLEMARRRECCWEGTSRELSPQGALAPLAVPPGDPARTTITSVATPWSADTTVSSSNGGMVTLQQTAGAAGAMSAAGTMSRRGSARPPSSDRSPRSTQELEGRDLQTMSYYSMV